MPAGFLSASGVGVGVGEQVAAVREREGEAAVLVPHLPLLCSMPAHGSLPNCTAEAPWDRQ